MGSEETVTEARELMRQLKDTKIPAKLAKENIINYDVPWTENAIDPNICPEHKTYIDRLCEDFDHILKEHITSAISEAEQSESATPLYNEIIQHIHFCQMKCMSFYGREDTLKVCRVTFC